MTFGNILMALQAIMILGITIMNGWSSWVVSIFLLGWFVYYTFLWDRYPDVDRDTRVTTAGKQGFFVSLVLTVIPVLLGLLIRW